MKSGIKFLFDSSEPHQSPAWRGQDLTPAFSHVLQPRKTLLDSLFGSLPCLRVLPRKQVFLHRSSGLAFSCCWLQKHGSLQQSSSRYGTCHEAAQPYRSPFKTLGSSLQFQSLFRLTSFGQLPPRTPPFSEQSHQAHVTSAFRNRHPARTRLAACLRTSCGFFVVVFKPYLKV